MRRLPPLQIPLDVAGLYLTVIGLYTTIQAFWLPICIYDEGILLSHTNALVHGSVPYRDFYTQYPPGIYLTIAALWKLFGVSIASERILGIVFRLGTAILAGRLAVRAAGRGFLWLPVGVTLVWLSTIGVYALAWFGALFGALLAIHECHSGPWSRARCLLRGGLVGLVGCFRHDLFIYFALTLGSAGAICAWRRGVAYRQMLALAGWMALGAAIPLAITYAPTLARAPLPQVLDDLYFDQTRFVVPARRLPFPELSSVFRGQLLPATILLSLAGPFLAAAFFVWRRRLDVVLLGALAVAVLPQMLVRSDVGHALFVVTPSIALFCTLFYEMGARATRLPLKIPAIGFAALVFLQCNGRLVFARGPLQPPVPDDQRSDDPRTRGIPVYPFPERREMLERVAATTRSGEAVFFGNASHRRLAINQVDLYFLADRPSATRWLQFDPGIVTRLDVQRAMIADLEAHRTRLLVLSNRWDSSEEPNQSSQLGSALLDDYIRERYELAWTIGCYRGFTAREEVASRRSVSAH